MSLRKTNIKFMGLPVLLDDGPGNRLQVESWDKKVKNYYGIQRCPIASLSDIDILEQKITEEQLAAMGYTLTRIIVGRELLELIAGHNKQQLEILGEVE